MSGISTEEFKRRLGLPVKPKALAPMDAEQLRKAGSAAAAVRIREAEEAKAKRAAALKRDHCERATLRIIGKPPSLNEYLSGIKNQIQAKGGYYEPIKEAWERAGRPVIASPYQYKLHLIRASKRGDRSNFRDGAWKAILDVLTSLGCIGGDSYEHDQGDGPNTQELADYWMVVFEIWTVAPVGAF